MYLRFLINEDKKHVTIVVNKFVEQPTSILPLNFFLLFLALLAATLLRRTELHLVS